MSGVTRVYVCDSDLGVSETRIRYIRVCDVEGGTACENFLLITPEGSCNALCGIG